MLHLVLLLLMQLFQRQTSLLVLAALVLEPDANNPRTETSHLDELFLHQSVGSRVGAVARAQRVKLFLVQHRPYPRRLLVGTFVRARSGARRVAAATTSAFSTSCVHH